MQKVFLLLSLSVLVLLSCSSNSTDPDKNSGIQLSTSYQWEQDSTHIYWVRDTMDCSQNASVHDSSKIFVDSLAKGSLILWDTLQCQALRFNGGNSTLIGEWKLARIIPLDSLGWENRQHPYCTPVDTVYWTYGTLKITSTQIQFTQNVPSFCPTQESPALLQLQDKGISKYSVSYKDCEHLQIQGDSAMGEIEIQDYNYSADAFTLQFTYQNKSCTFSDPGRNACPTGTADFSMCLLNSGL